MRLNLLSETRRTQINAKNNADLRESILILAPLAPRGKRSKMKSVNLSNVFTGGAVD